VPEDRRSLLIELTYTAKELVDQAIPRHIENEQAMLSVLTPRERAELTRLTGKLIDHLAE
jgi:DNA-binding MarR family transcriptional regulator